MPSAFSPNGDGKNDVYRIPPDAALTLTEFLIYDRWGKLVFSSKNNATGWDGKIKGEDAATGNYIFVISGTNTKGKVFLKGNFILIR
jgi:gliding motility-associated-like protein